MAQNKIEWCNILSVARFNGLPIILALMMPCQTAESEYGFSCQNSIKTSHHNKLNKINVADIEKKACRIYKNESHQ